MSKFISWNAWSFISFFIQWVSNRRYALICATILRSWYNQVFRQTHVFPRDWKMLHFLLIIHDLSIQHTELEFGHNRDKWIRWFLNYTRDRDYFQYIRFYNFEISSMKRKKSKWSITFRMFDVVQKLRQSKLFWLFIVSAVYLIYNNGGFHILKRSWSLNFISGIFLFIENSIEPFGLSTYSCSKHMRKWPSKSESWF